MGAAATALAGGAGWVVRDGGAQQRRGGAPQAALALASYAVVTGTHRFERTKPGTLWRLLRRRTRATADARRETPPNERANWDYLDVADK